MVILWLSKWHEFSLLPNSSLLLCREVEGTALEAFSWEKQSCTETTDDVTANLLDSIHNKESAGNATKPRREKIEMSPEYCANHKLSNYALWNLFDIKLLNERKEDLFKHGAKLYVQIVRVVVTSVVRKGGRLWAVSWSLNSASDQVQCVLYVSKPLIIVFMDS